MKDFEGVNIGQKQVDQKLKSYLEAQGRSVNEILDSKGNCTGWSFIFLRYTSMGKRHEFYNMLKFISKLDEPFNVAKAQEAFALTDFGPAYEPRKILQPVEVFLEEITNELVMFQHTAKISQELSFGFHSHPSMQQERQFLYNFTEGEKEVNPVFSLEEMLLNEEQFAEILEILSHWPDTCIDVGLPEHTTALYVTQEGGLLYYDSNRKLPLLNAVKPEKLAKHIFSSLSVNSQMEIRFGGYKFYNKASEKPKIESASDVKQASILENSLTAALLLNDTEKVKFLIEMNPEDAVKPDKFGVTPMKRAIEMGNLAIIDLLLEKYGIKPGFEDIEMASRLGHHEIFKRIFDSNPPDVSENTLLYAMMHDDIDMVSAILEKYPELGCTPEVRTNLVKCHDEILEIFIKSDFKNYEGKFSFSQNNPRMNTLMKKLGSGILSFNFLNKAIESNNKEMSFWLLEKITIDSAQRDTLIYLAAENGSLEILDILMQGHTGKLNDVEKEALKCCVNDNKFKCAQKIIEKADEFNFSELFVSEKDYDSESDSEYESDSDIKHDSKKVSPREKCLEKIFKHIKNKDVLIEPDPKTGKTLLMVAEDIGDTQAEKVLLKQIEKHRLKQKRITPVLARSIKDILLENSVKKDKITEVSPHTKKAAKTRK